MKNRIDAGPMDEITLMPETEAAEIIQNVRMISATEAGSAPMCRNIGVSTEARHRPESVAKAILIRDVFTAVREQETRAELETVTVETTEKPGNLRPVMEVKIGGR